MTVRAESAITLRIKTAVGSTSLLLALFVLAQGAPAQSAADRFDCRLMRGLQCRAESRAELLALYALPTAESRLAAGSEMYRVFVFDAWMRHHVAITVERSPGSSPTLTLQAPPRPNRRGAASEAIPPLSVPITIRDWYAVRRRASYFDRVMVPEPEPDDPNVISFCSGHGPLYFVESGEGETGEDFDDRRLRRSGLGHCTEGLAEPFGLEVALLAADVLPACAALDEEGFRFTAERLRACTILSGDRLAAAEVYNLMRPLLAEGRARPSADQLAFLFSGAEIEGSGAGEGVSSADAWLQALAGGQRTHFVVEQVHSRDAGHVVVEGLMRRRIVSRVDEEEDRTEEARVELVWTRGPLSDFEIERLTIGAFEQVPDLCNSADHTRRAVDC